jgi:rsbT co-antagonist protein RsbR
MGLKADQGKRLAAMLAEHSEAISAKWSDVVAASLRGRLSPAESRRQITDLQGHVLSALQHGALGLDDEKSTELRAVLTELSRSRARQGFSATETSITIFALKNALSQTLDLEKGSEKALRDYVAISSFVDDLGLFTFEAYSRARERVIAEQSEQLLELSTPVVKLWEGVVAVPLVGTLDSARAQIVMERLLQALIDNSSPYAIIDITGVLAVDTQVAQHILKTVMAARLMGAECIISGIRPQIAQTIVALGIEFGDIVTKASLADALRHAIRLSSAATRREA